jgi:hypothetical protein
MSAETLDPRSNVFYSHSYIYYFGSLRTIWVG